MPLYGMDLGREDKIAKPTGPAGDQQSSSLAIRVYLRAIIKSSKATKPLNISQSLALDKMQSILNQAKGETRQHSDPSHPSGGWEREVVYTKLGQQDCLTSRG